MGLKYAKVKTVGDIKTEDLINDPIKYDDLKGWVTGHTPGALSRSIYGPHGYLVARLQLNGELHFFQGDIPSEQVPDDWSLHQVMKLVFLKTQKPIKK